MLKIWIKPNIFMTTGITVAEMRVVLQEKDKEITEMSRKAELPFATLIHSFP